MLHISVPGTTANLGPGFDCLGMSLGLYNTLSMSRASEFDLEVEGEGQQSLPRGEDNLVVRAIDRVLAEVGRSRPPIKLKLMNAIPLSRGMGSSSAATVAGLLAGNVLAGETFSRDWLLRLALEFEGHPDNVAPAFFGGLVVSWKTEKGEPFYLSLGVPHDLAAVVCIPEAEVSTEAARRALPREVPMEDAVFNLSRLALLLGCFWKGRHDLLGAAGQDRLHQPYRAQLVPGMKEAMAAAQEHGAYSAMISGSGPTLLALTLPGTGRQIGPPMVHAFRQAGVKARWMELELKGEGARVYAQT